MAETIIQTLANIKSGTSLQTPYQQGMRDAFKLLGLLNDANTPTGEVSALLFDVLRAHAQDGATVQFDWNTLDLGNLRGVDLIMVIEKARLIVVPNPTPARVVSVVEAIIKRKHNGIDHYYMQYDVHAQRYQPIGGKRNLEDANDETALRREMFEELELSHIPSKSEVALRKVASQWQQQALSATYGVLTRYTFSFFFVETLKVDLLDNAGNQWLSQSEISRGTADDGRAISPIYSDALGWEHLNFLPETKLS